MYIPFLDIVNRSRMVPGVDLTIYLLKMQHLHIFGSNIYMCIYILNVYIWVVGHWPFHARM